MADQIIIELIGDPSGLKPAEEALKELSKATAENLEAFKKANEAMSKYSADAAAAAKATKTFEESAKEVGKAITGITESATKSITAISSLQTAIAGGAIKAATEEIKTYTGQMRTLGEEKDKLIAKLKTESEEYDALKKEIELAGTSYKNMQAAADTATRTFDNNKKSIDELERVTSRLTATNDKAVMEMILVEDAMKKMEAENQQSSSTYTELQTKLANLNTSYDANKKVIDDNKTAAAGLKTENIQLENSLAGLGRGMKENQEKVEQHENAIKKTREEIIENAKATAKAALEHNKFYKGLGTGIETMEHMKSVGEAVSKGMKAFGIENEKVEAGLKKFSQALDFAKGVQTAMNAVSQMGAAVTGLVSAAEITKTGAMGASTVATWLAAAAATGLSIAMSPITLIIVGIAAAAALMIGQFYLLYQIGGSIITVVRGKATAFQEFGKIVTEVGKTITEVTDKIRDFLSVMTLGFVDNAAVHKQRDAVEALGKEHDKNSEKLKKQIDLMEAQGASAEKILEKKKEQLLSDKELLDKQMELAKSSGDTAKQKELQNKLDENAIALIKNKKELDEAAKATEAARYETMKQEGATALEIWKAKQKENEEATKASDLALSQHKTNIANLDIEIKRIQASGMLTPQMLSQLVTLMSQSEELKKQTADLEHQNKVLHTQKSDIASGIAEENKKRSDALAQYTSDTLAHAKTVADGRLSIAQKGSEEELKLKINDLNASAAIELNNVQGTEKQKKELRDIIHTKLKQDTEAANNAFQLKKLADEKKNLEVMLLLNKDNNAETLRLSISLADQERKIALAQANLSANEKLLIEKNYTDKVHALHKTAEDAQKASNLKALDDTKATLQKEVEAEVDTQAKKYKLAQDAQEKDKATLDKKLEALKKEQTAELDIISAATKAGRLTAEQAERELEKINLKYRDAIKKTEDDITAKKKQEAKKQEDLAKKLGAEAIKIGKEVADAIFDNEAEKRKQALDDKISKLNEHKEAELANHHLTAAQKKAIEAKYRREEAKAKLEAWKKDQEAKAEQAIINGLLAFAAAIAQDPTAGYVQGAIALATAGVQAGIILSKTPPKFAQGVIALEGPGTETSDSIPAYLSRGESVITAERTRQYKPLLEQIQAGVYQPLPIPLLSTFPRLHDISDLRAQHTSIGIGTSIDYEKLGRAVAKNIPSPVINNIRMDENGFSKSILKKGSKTEYYNNQMKF